MSRDGLVALPRGATGLSAVCDCGISLSYSITFFSAHRHTDGQTEGKPKVPCDVKHLCADPESIVRGGPIFLSNFENFFFSSRGG